MPGYDHTHLRTSIAAAASALSDNAIAPALVAAAIGQGGARLTGDGRANEVAAAAHLCAETWSLVASLARQDGPARGRVEQAARAAAVLPSLERDLVTALEIAGARQDLRTGA